MAADTGLQSYVDENNDVMVDWRRAFQKVSLAGVGRSRIRRSNERVSTQNEHIYIYILMAWEFVFNWSTFFILRYLGEWVYLCEMKRGRSGVEKAREVLHVSVYTVSAAIRLCWTINTNFGYGAGDIKMAEQEHPACVGLRCVFYYYFIIIYLLRGEGWIWSIEGGLLLFRSLKKNGIWLPIWSPRSSELNPGELLPKLWTRKKNIEPD